ncbi:bifunctional acetate--CoA ligase family protein/GNAT family N-acetyltransferase [Halomonas sp. ISL-60]|uniref:bifunctional acetate--CoA ligase family protein/GNAT family N-acetyltransferase n=1 Tax=Halomonas sp. ISL-56 TaxID=2819149 RepID=UPI001BEC6F95|nr:bifunctional acetate--CoA ligase family protein/GNAT family N-acetyltransferase [Halomonas sp. ISL-56]MBT2774336.1 bifunctional acetate--CoA ligase family protein/GNAT family N-acetyltransferase [Halomonas sp. ISL-60]MBT2799905.1 bifunctional acetate--CoA ligase family protein/GNAT family N-acetyltransferase [Halomonas sp. ISL-56]
MSIRNLDALFSPGTIALIGASNQPGSVGAVLARNLFSAGFAGPVLTVNPNERAIRSTLNYHSVSELPLSPELAIIATPPETVPGLIKELGEQGCRAAVVITAGFGEGTQREGKALKQAMLEAARPYLMRIVGPNCLGILAPHNGLNASFAHLSPQKGNVAFVSQSGAVATSILDWASARGIGFSYVISLGSMSDVDFGDVLDFLALDPKTHSILLYVEAITDARKFLSAARTASRNKPVVVVKAGRSESGAKAALSHTGAMAGSDIIYDAAFRRAGMLRVKTLDELFQAAGTLATGIHVQGERLAILTNGGGVGVLAVDELAEVGGHLAELSEATLARLDAVLPKAWSHDNPVDILGDASGQRYADALEVLLDERQADALFIINCPVAVADSVDAAQAVMTTLNKRRLPVLTCWLGEGAPAEARRLFVEKRIPSYDTPEQAIRAFWHLSSYWRNQRALMETPAAMSDLFRIDIASANAIIERVIEDDRSLLTEPESSAILAAYGIPTVPAIVALTPEDASRAAQKLGFPVVLKVLSRDISHKSDVGGVQLNLASPDAVYQAAEKILAAVRQAAPMARVDGFNVQPMIRRPGAHELILGVAEDSVFGPIILFGQGGKAVEVISDRVIGLPPLNSLLAQDMIRSTRISRLLQGYRDHPTVDMEAITLTLIRLSQLVSDLGQIVELDINPLLADATGVIALDARIVIKTDQRLPMAIRPYPKQFEKTISARCGQAYFLRPIRPEDEDGLVNMLRQSSPNDVRLRFFAAIKKFDHAFAARLTQIDYDREMAFVAMLPGSEEIVGVVRLSADPDKEKAEFAVMVRSDIKGTGLGYTLMQQIIDYARNSAIKQVFADVLRENHPMLKMVTELGFRVQSTDHQADSITVVLDL